MRRRRTRRSHRQAPCTEAAAAPAVAAVVVGVARDDRSDSALEWAAAEAAARAVPLRIVHAFWVPRLADPWAALSGPPLSDSAARAARQVLDNATVHVLSVAPGVEVSTLAYQGSVPDAMGSGGGDGVVVVLGSGVATRNLRLLSRVRRTTAERVAESGHAPLVVVSLAGRQSAGPSRGRVVVGVGDDESPAGGGSSLAYAFDAALRRGTGVSVVRAWTPAVTDELLVEHALSERTQQEFLHRAVAPYRDVFPGVDVRERVLLESAPAALVDESDGATLLVVGSGRRRGLLRLRPGQVRRAVLRSAHAPVVVVPDAAPAAPHSWWRRLVLPPALGVVPNGPVSAFLREATGGFGRGRVD